VLREHSAHSSTQSIQNISSVTREPGTTHIKQPASPSYPGAAAIVYLKETQKKHTEPPPTPPATIEDIELIKKTVTRSSVIAQKQKTTAAINLPAAQADRHSRSSGGIPYDDIDRQANAIADKVYSVLERRLRSERMRKGLL
jgi:hypothetical protein